jgi:hypothetical protein
MSTVIGVPRAIRGIVFRRHAAAAALLGLLAVAACATTTETPPAHSRVSVVLDPASVDDLLTAITKSGLAAPHPHDVTSRDCPQLGCAAKIETDTISIIKFPQTGSAEQYASWTDDRYQIADVVVTFPPSMPGGQRTGYENAVKRAIA